MWNIKKEKGWIVPFYCLPENAEDIEIMHTIVRENFTLDMAATPVDDIKEVFKFFKSGAKSEEIEPCPSKKVLAHIC